MCKAFEARPLTTRAENRNGDNGGKYERMDMVNSCHGKKKLKLKGKRRGKFGMWNAKTREKRKLFLARGVRQALGAITHATCGSNACLGSLCFPFHFLSQTRNSQLNAPLSMDPSVPLPVDLSLGCDGIRDMYNSEMCTPYSVPYLGTCMVRRQGGPCMTLSSTTAFQGLFSPTALIRPLTKTRLNPQKATRHATSCLTL
jgi:hypothetical protein